MITQIDKKRIPNRTPEIRLFANLRDESFRLPYFLSYYKRLGVDRFFLILDRSPESIVKYCTSQPNVHIFEVEDTFTDENQIRWHHQLLHKFGSGQWCVCVDIDEFLVYSSCEKSFLPDLTRSLEQDGSNAMYTPLLDMYPQGELFSSKLVTADSPFDLCPFFDSDFLSTHQGQSSFPNIPNHVGGMRQRLFGLKVCLSKVGLIKYDERMEFKVGRHGVSNVEISNKTGVLLHFKFMDNWKDYVERSVEEENHWRDSYEYKIYLKHIKENPKLSAFWDGSTAYNSSEQLVKLGIISE